MLVNSKEFESSSSGQWDSASPLKVVQRGVGCVRLEGHRGHRLSNACVLSLPIIVHLARHFSTKVAAHRASGNDDDGEPDDALYFEGVESSVVAGES